MFVCVCECVCVCVCVCVYVCAVSCVCVHIHTSVFLSLSLLPLFLFPKFISFPLFPSNFLFSLFFKHQKDYQMVQIYNVTKLVFMEVSTTSTLAQPIGVAEAQWVQELAATQPIIRGIVGRCNLEVSCLLNILTIDVVVDDYYCYFLCVCVCVCVCFTLFAFAFAFALLFFFFFFFHFPFFFLRFFFFFCTEFSPISSPSGWYCNRVMPTGHGQDPAR